MNKSEHLMFFLGQVKARIEEINRYAMESTPCKITDIITDLESFFNQGFNEFKDFQDKPRTPQAFSGQMELTLWT